jgi:glycerophosphoryl diester phosphodiesterase
MSKIIGHRGSKGEFPENTLLGIKKAIENKADGIEIDVHLTKDNELVVIHDPKVDRTTDGKGEVKKLTLKQIKKLDAGQKQQVPTLQEVLDLVKELKTQLWLEIKCHNAEENVANILKNNNLIKNTVVKSFDHRIVKRIKEINKNIKTACLFVGLPVHVYKIIQDAKADAISINANTVDKELIDECHKKGYEVFVWNIDEKSLLKKYINMGADYIGTNFPSKMK